MELLLDLNQNPALPPDLRFDISLQNERTAVASIPSVVPPEITPQGANDLLMEYTVAVQRGQIPHLDLHVIRAQIDKRLAKQGVTSLDHLESTVSHAIPDADFEQLPDILKGSNPPGFLTSEEEEAYLLRLDVKLGDPLSVDRAKEKEGGNEEKHWAELTAREVERQVELQNPQSQHNWLKTHTKPNGADENDDAESLTSQAVKAAQPRGGKGKRDLAKQVGDRAVGRARDGYSPSAASAGYGEEDELSFVDEYPATGSSKKRGRGDADGTYRVKGGKTSAAKGGKRKRADEQAQNSPSQSTHSASKKARLEN